MTSPRISISRYGESSTFGSVPDRRRSDLRMPQFFKRLFKFPQMDFEMAIWEMTHLLIAPKKVFKSIFYQKRPFPTPESIGYLLPEPDIRVATETRNTYHRADPAFSYLFAFFLTLTSFAWGIAYSPSLSAITKLMLMFVFVHFLFGSLFLSTLAYFFIGRLLGPGIAGLPGRRRRQGLFGPPGGSGRGDLLEFGYCFDVSIRAFFPTYILLYIVQYILMPFIGRHNAASTFFGNLLYLVAATYWTVITFLGYNALHFLHHTQLLLTPMAGWVSIWLVCTILGVNLPMYGVKWMFLGVQLKQ